MVTLRFFKFVAPTPYHSVLRGLCHTATLFFSAAVLFGVGVVRGQDGSGFSLFEPLDLVTSADNSDRSRRRVRSSAGGAASETGFSLIGTSRIGSRTSVMLRHASGEKVSVRLNRPRMRIPGYDGYVVVGSDRNSVSIQYPESEACVEFAPRGVSCDAAGNIATLNLRVFKTSEQSQEQTKSEQPEVEGEVERGTPSNPFETLRNRSQRNSSAPGRTDRFQPRRIAPEDVPPGMRLVSTPFGDRLVEE